MARLDRIASAEIRDGAVVIIGGRTLLRTCRGCGCDDDYACETPDGPCSWVLLDVDLPTGVCSACAVRAGWDMRALATMGFVDVDEASS